MDFVESLRQLSSRIEKVRPQLLTEEATKMSLVIPFFQILGYDVFNPHEFIPEFHADVGIKKGEKVDYAIVINGDPAILVEAKACTETLDKHDSQLFRYFGTTTAKFGILTNGIQYKFYTDLEEKNKMDLSPFLEVDLLNLKDNLVNEVKKFHKDAFNVDSIFSTASELKYSKSIKEYFSAQLQQPSDDFIKILLSSVYSGIKTQAVVEKFRPLVQRSLNDYITEKMNDKITMALKSDEAKQKAEQAEAEKAKEAEQQPPVPNIITTAEELEAYYLVKGLLVGVVSSERLSYKDTESYLGILIDGSIRKWICRLDLNSAKKKLLICGENKETIKYDIESIDAIYLHKDDIIKSAKRFISDLPETK